MVSDYTVLYYPSFQPDPVWLRRILLVADHVARIVPTDVKLQDPKPIIDLLTVLPGSLVDLPPTPDDIKFDDIGLSRVDKAFRFIAANASMPRNRIELTIHDGGAVAVAGHMFLHRSKVAPEVGRLLQRHKLARKDINAVVRKASGNAGYIVVDGRASHLVLSCIADRMARRNGLDAITDRPLDFGVNALDNLRITDGAENSEGALLASIASVSIPSEISTLDVRQYKAIRDSYSEVRAAFRPLIVELSSLNRLGKISDPAVLRKRIADLANDFATEYEVWRKTRFARAFKSWTPLCVGGLLSVATAFVQPIAAAAIATATFGLQVIEKCVTQSEAHNPKDRVYQMLVGLRRDIIKRSPIRRLL
jgi:hypothetical protein